MKNLIIAISTVTALIFVFLGLSYINGQYITWFNTMRWAYVPIGFYAGTVLAFFECCIFAFLVSMVFAIKEGLDKEGGSND